MTLLNKESVKRVEKLLKEFDPKQSIMLLDSSARTAIEAASSLGCELGAIVKSLLFKTENTFSLFLVAGDKKASPNKIKKILDIQELSMASAEEVKNITGYTIGGVAPIGHLNKVDIYLDNTLERFTHIFGAAGHPNCVFKINFKDLQKITKASVKEITE